MHMPRPNHLITFTLPSQPPNHYIIRNEQLLWHSSLPRSIDSATLAPPAHNDSPSIGCHHGMIDICMALSAVAVLHSGLTRALEAFLVAAFTFILATQGETVAAGAGVK